MKTSSTEKQFYKTLVSSVCGILACMACLVGTTWAWFTVSIENTGNIIEIATITANVDISVDGGSFVPKDDGSYVLDVGNYGISIGLEQPDKTPADANLLKASQCPVYVIMTVRQEENAEYRLFTFTDRETKQNHQLTVGEGSAAVSFSVSWVKPVFDIPDGSEPVVIGEMPTEPATESSTQTATVPDKTSTPSTTDPSSASEETIAPTIIPAETTGPVTEPQGTTTPVETD